MSRFLKEKTIPLFGIFLCLWMIIGSVSFAGEYDPVEAFVERLYQNVLNRSSDAEGLEYWTVALNEYLLEHGYADTRTSGTLHPANTAGAYLGGATTTSIVDCGNLLSSIYYRTCVSEKASEEMENLMLQCQRRFNIPAGLPYGTKCANKTGENDYVQNDVAIVYSPGCDYVICILSEETYQYISIPKMKEISSLVYDYFNE